MSYQTISVKEAVERVNASANGWFIPHVQRPYVWGSRYEKETYICKLFDSLLRGYPIGGLILWNTERGVPYREFICDYHENTDPKIVDKGLWDRKDKWLVYDGQQRIQTIFSCLRYTFNNKVLVYNLLFDLKNTDSDPNETGFSFMEKNSPLGRGFLRMNELFSQAPKDRRCYRKRTLSLWDDLDESKKDAMEDNLDMLWKVFVERDKKSLAYFPIASSEEVVVNEIFQRLNIGGVTLSQADLLFSQIKGNIRYDFEEQLQAFSRRIYNNTGGYFFDAYSILQLIYLLVKNNIRVDTRKITSKKELAEFNKTWEHLQRPLFDFFTDFIWGQFKINNMAIIPKKMAIFPLIAYLFFIYQKGITFKKLPQKTLLKLKQYFILSQINDWNLQGIIDKFYDIIKQNAVLSEDFPIDKMLEWLNSTKRRNTELFESMFVDYKWFSLKILMPQRVYQFDPDLMGRYKPEIDHIFPSKLENQSSSYYENVDIIWNMQPIKGDINNFKKRHHPKEFLKSKEGEKYICDYDFLPATDLDDSIWDKPLEFIKERGRLMKEYLKKEYRLEIK